MINETHLAVVRAALTFWDEEISMVTRSVYRHYLHSSDSERVLSTEDVAVTRQFFNNVELRFASVNDTTGEMTFKSRLGSPQVKEENGERAMVVAFVSKEDG